MSTTGSRSDAPDEHADLSDEQRELFWELAVDYEDEPLGELFERIVQASVEESDEPEVRTS